MRDRAPAVPPPAVVPPPAGVVPAPVLPPAALPSTCDKPPAAAAGRPTPAGVGAPAPPSVAGICSNCPAPVCVRAPPKVGSSGGIAGGIIGACVGTTVPPPDAATSGPSVCARVGTNGSAPAAVAVISGAPAPPITGADSTVPVAGPRRLSAPAP